MARLAASLATATGAADDAEDKVDAGELAGPAVEIAERGETVLFCDGYCRTF